MKTITLEVIWEDWDKTGGGSQLLLKPPYSAIYKPLAFTQQFEDYWLAGFYGRASGTTTHKTKADAQQSIEIELKIIGN